MESDKAITRRGALKLGALCATGSAVLSQSTGMGRASQHEPPSEDEVSLSNDDIAYIEPTPDAGFHYPYFLYAPPGADSLDGHERPLFVEPTATGVSRNSFVEMMDFAKRKMEGYVVSVADQLRIPAIHPIFPKYRDDPYFYYQDAQTLTRHVLTLDESEQIARPDKQLLAMVEDARQRLEGAGHMLADDIHLDGFSASGQFSRRFTVMHPERVNAMSAGGGGTLILPMAQLADGISTAGDPDWEAFGYPEGSLPYPAGAYDLADIVGKEFDREAWMSVGKYLFLGSEDNPDPEEDQISYRGFTWHYEDPDRVERRSQGDYYGIPELMLDIYGKYRADTRWPVSKAAYQAVDPDAEFRLYEGVGHKTTRQMVQDIVDFHKTHIINTYGPVATREEIAVQGGYLTEDGTRELNTGEQMIYTAVFKNHRNVPENVTVTLTIDGTEVESVTRELPPERTRRIPLPYTFTDPGTYTVQINGDEPEPQPLTVLPAETPTPTPAPTPSPTPTPVPETPTDTATPHETPGDSGPGFGIGAALGGVAATGYMLMQSNNDSD